MKKITFLLVFSTGLIGCNEKIKTNIVQGKLLENCQGKSISDTELILVQSKQQKVIASTSSDAEGNFQLSYEMDEDISGSSEIKYFNGEVFEQIMTSIPLNESHFLIARKENSYELEVNVQRTSAPAQDTLIFSVKDKNAKHKIISPKNGDIKKVQIALSNSYDNSGSKTFYWGLGENDYQKAKSSLDTKNPYHQATFVAKACETHNVTIEL